MSGGICWNYPPPSNSHHQGIIPILLGNPYKPSFVTVTGWGVDLRYMYVLITLAYKHLHPRKYQKSPRVEKVNSILFQTPSF